MSVRSEEKKTVQLFNRLKIIATVYIPVSRIINNNMFYTPAQCFNNDEILSL